MRIMNIFGKKSKTAREEINQGMEEVAASTVTEQPIGEEVQSVVIPDINKVLIDRDVYNFYKEAIRVVASLYEFKDLYKGRVPIADTPLDVIAKEYVRKSKYNDTTTGTIILSLVPHHDLMRKVLISKEMGSLKGILTDELFPYQIEEVCGSYIIDIRKIFLTHTPL